MQPLVSLNTIPPNRNCFRNSPRVSHMCSQIHDSRLQYRIPYPLAPFILSAAATMKLRKTGKDVLLKPLSPEPVQARPCWPHMGLGQPAKRRSPSLGLCARVASISGTNALCSQHLEHGVGKRLFSSLIFTLGPFPHGGQERGPWRVRAKSS